MPCFGVFWESKLMSFEGWELVKVEFRELEGGSEFAGVVEK